MAHHAVDPRPVTESSIATHCHAWLCSIGLIKEAKAKIEDLLFNEDGLLSYNTDDTLDIVQKL